MINPFNKLAIIFISIYKTAISPYLAPRCRFYPSCSTYSLQAFKEHNFFKALFLSVIRISKCHPFHPGGYDPLPTNKEKENG